MSWIREDENGVITSVSRKKETDDQVKIAKDDPRLLEFLNPSLPTASELYDQTMQNNSLLKAVVIALNKAGAFSSDGLVLTPTKLKTAIKKEM